MQHIQIGKALDRCQVFIVSTEADKGAGTESQILVLDKTLFSKPIGDIADITFEHLNGRKLDFGRVEYRPESPGTWIYGVALLLVAENMIG